MEAVLITSVCLLAIGLGFDEAHESTLQEVLQVVTESEVAVVSCHFQDREIPNLGQHLEAFH